MTDSYAWVCSSSVSATSVGSVVSVSSASSAISFGSAVSVSLVVSASSVGSAVSVSAASVGYVVSSTASVTSVSVGSAAVSSANTAVGISVMTIMITNKILKMRFIVLLSVFFCSMSAGSCLFLPIHNNFTFLQRRFTIGIVGIARRFSVCEAKKQSPDPEDCLIYLFL